jgi:hypothetical protein
LVQDGSNLASKTTTKAFIFKSRDPSSIFGGKSKEWKRVGERERERERDLVGTTTTVCRISQSDVHLVNLEIG